MDAKDIEIWEAIPQTVKSRIEKLLVDIHNAGVYGGESTAAAIEQLEKYKKDLWHVL